MEILVAIKILRFLQIFGVDGFQLFNFDFRVVLESLMVFRLGAPPFRLSMDFINSSNCFYYLSSSSSCRFLIISFTGSLSRVGDSGTGGAFSNNFTGVDAML